MDHAETWSANQSWNKQRGINHAGKKTNKQKTKAKLAARCYNVPAWHTFTWICRVSPCKATAVARSRQHRETLSRSSKSSNCPCQTVWILTFKSSATSVCSIAVVSNLWQSWVYRQIRCWVFLPGHCVCAVHPAHRCQTDCSSSFTCIYKLWSIGRSLGSVSTC